MKNAQHKLSARISGLDVETRWSSSYVILDVALDAKPVMIAMDAECSELKIFFIGTSEWNNIKKLCKLLKLFHDATLT